MKTDDLISMLAREPAGLTAPPQGERVRAAVAVAAGGSFAIMIAWLGLNPELRSDLSLPMFWVKAGFALSLVIAFGFALSRLGRPGRNAKPMFAAAGLFALAMLFLGVVAALTGDREEVMAALRGYGKFDCPISIATLSIPIFIASFWAMRQFAPTQLTLAGGVAGLFSGAVGASIYALHCVGYHPTYVAVWYTVGMLIPGIVGAALGRSLLRW
jgi:hypothetical protein